MVRRKGRSLCIQSVPPPLCRRRPFWVLDINYIAQLLLMEQFEKFFIKLVSSFWSNTWWKMDGWQQRTFSWPTASPAALQTPLTAGCQSHRSAWPSAPPPMSPCTPPAPPASQTPPHPHLLHLLHFHCILLIYLKVGFINNRFICPRCVDLEIR